MKNTVKLSPVAARFTKRWPTLTTFETCCLLWCVIGLTNTLPAQVINASGQITSQPAGGGLYDYTLTLNNLSSSTSPIETFWFAWLPNGDNFLPSPPSSVQAPAGWGSAVISGSYGYYYYDYSIEFTSSSAPLNPGQSLSFGFVSSDPPSVVGGQSSIYPGYAVATSYLYSGIVTGTGAEVVLQLVPEPSAQSLLLAASLAFFLTRRCGQQLRRCTHAPPPLTQPGHIASPAAQVN